MRIKVEVIQDFMKNYGISINKLGKLCNISRKHIQNVLENSKNTTYESLEKIAKLMNISILDIVE